MRLPLRRRLNAAKVTMIALLSVVALVLITVGGYLGGWWLKEDSTNRNTEIQDSSYGRQTALVDEVLDSANEVARIDVAIASADTATQEAYLSQRAAIVLTMCDSAAKLTGKVPLSASAESLIFQECE
jgi:hypothetical protein